MAHGNPIRARATTVAARRSARSRAAGEDGYILVAVIFLTVILLIGLAVAAPKVAADIQRDREVETMHRGQQYVRAIQLYYHKFNAYPPSLDALNNTNNMRFLRKKYTDPMTGKADWRLIHFGEAKTQSLGFFGQPIAGSGSAGGSVLAGTGPGGVAGAGSIGSPIGGAGQTTSASNPDPSNPGPSNLGGIGAGGGLNGTGTSGIGGGSTGQTFGGGGIIGVSPTSPKPSILIYKKKQHYNEWEFVYDPLVEQMRNGGGNLGAIGQPAGGLGSSQQNLQGTQPQQPLAPTQTPGAPQQ